MPFVLVFNHPVFETLHQIEEQAASIQDIPYTETDISFAVANRLQEILNDSENDDYDEFIQRCIYEELPEEFIEFLDQFKTWLERKLTSRLDRAILRLDSTVMNAMRSLEIMDENTAVVTVDEVKHPTSSKKKVKES